MELDAIARHPIRPVEEADVFARDCRFMLAQHERGLAFLVRAFLFSEAASTTGSGRGPAARGCADQTELWGKVHTLIESQRVTPVQEDGRRRR